MIGSLKPADDSNWMPYYWWQEMDVKRTGVTINGCHNAEERNCILYDWWQQMDVKLMVLAPVYIINGNDIGMWQ